MLHKPKLILNIALFLCSVTHLSAFKTRAQVKQLFENDIQSYSFRVDELCTPLHKNPEYIPNLIQVLEKLQVTLFLEAHYVTLEYPDYGARYHNLHNRCLEQLKIIKEHSKN